MPVLQGGIRIQFIFTRRGGKRPVLPWGDSIGGHLPIWSMAERQPRRVDRFGDAWQVIPSDCATYLDPVMYGKYSRLSPYHRYTRKRWRTGIALITPDKTPRGLLREVRACGKLPGYMRPHSRETLPRDLVVDLHTNNRPHRCPVVLPARLLIQRP